MAFIYWGKAVCICVSLCIFVNIVKHFKNLEAWKTITFIMGIVITIIT